MAEQVKGNYKDTDTYKSADPKTRAAIERYKKDNKIANEQLYLLLLRQDLRDLPKEEKQKGNRLAEVIVVAGIITFLIMTAADRKDLLPFAASYMIVVTIVYFSGILNPISRRLSNINKLLKKFPQVPDIRNVLHENKEEE